jgi:hypothetical protein
MGEEDKSGPYVQLVILACDEPAPGLPQRVCITLGVAEILAAELAGILDGQQAVQPAGDGSERYC